jgi:NAD(P)-dependent dehydrogenase (short-subunit alcohol dehydrogenase family)
MMKGLACMVAPKIRVNSISPGLLLTVSFSYFQRLALTSSNPRQEWSERFSDEAKESHRQKTKLKRFISVEVSK